MTHKQHVHRHVTEAKNPNGTINQLTVVAHTLESVQAILQGRLVILEMSENPIPGHPNQIDFHFRARSVPENEAIKPL